MLLPTKESKYLCWVYTCCKRERRRATRIKLVYLDFIHQRNKDNVVLESSNKNIAKSCCRFTWDFVAW
ncbi:hypothetical protein K7X08_005492 [Anisodus acutangulus]|uniref:Uncharacterized protein n=1 Tax=Anisodus acutangulus TaxID=402998 RepID=A0A9Q1LUZ8_9SOLA|nr:hypothetical protein K7X08_005492 [Anisodus acutangulus]